MGADPSLPTRLVWSLGIEPETWRADLLRVVLRVTAVLGGVVAIPSIALSVEDGLWGVAALDTVAIVGILALNALEGRLPARARAALTCTVYYALGTGLLVGVGSIAQIYLLGFSLLTTLLLGRREGMWSASLNAATMLVVGWIGIAGPDMVVPRWHYTPAAWALVTANFALVDVSLVLALGAVIRALESALARALASRELLRIAGLTARLGGWRLDGGTSRAEWSDEVCALFEVPPGTRPPAADALGDVLPADRDATDAALAACFRDGTPFDLEARVRTARGAELWVRCIGRAARGPGGGVAHVHGSVQDVTAQKDAEAVHARLEEQLRHAQKMEAIGRLAGGIAHDFNNLLSVVLGTTELLVDELAPDDPVRADLEEVRQAGLRARDLTRQLLAFGRKQILRPAVLDLADVVTGVERMLTRLVGEDIALDLRHAPPARVWADAGQLEQVLVNLVVNARDAMPAGGTVTVRTDTIALSASDAEPLALPPGRYARLCVGDTGIGMDEATRARIFEPFFTTKDPSRGTGLGLATVYGIVQQSGGAVRVESRVGRGTTFEILLPETDRPADVAARPDAREVAAHGTETLLVVEDDPPVREILRTVLARRGWRVLAAGSGAEALALLAAEPGAVHLLVTDVVMPGMSGPKLAEEVRARHPGMPVLVVSGYTEEALGPAGALGPGVDLLQKPILPDALAAKVRAVLDARSRRGG